MNEQTSENIRLLKGFYHAISRGDMESIRAALAPEVDWIEPKE